MKQKFGMDGNLKRVVNKDGVVYTFNKRTKRWEKFISERARVKIVSNKLKRNKTYAEKVLQKIFRSLGIRCSFQKPIKVGDNKYRYVDMYLPALRWVIEVDGEYHFTEEQQKLDEERTKQIIRATGYRVLRFTNDEVINNPKVIVDQLIKGIQNRFNKYVDKQMN